VTASPESIRLASEAAAAADDKFAADVIAYDVSDQLALADVFVLCSAPTDRQVSAIVDAVEDRLKPLVGRPVRREGEREARWVLLDYADVVVHVMQSEDRAFYALERLWKDCPTLGVLDGQATRRVGER
jgi:ribosome-associated protein